LTEEHVIPKALGGKLTANFLCVECNSRIGHSIEGDAKTDPDIRQLVTRLAPSIPQLAEKISERQKYISTGPGPKSSGRIKEGAFIASPTKLPDGSLIHSIDEGIRVVKRLLEREGMDEASVAEAVRIFMASPENTPVRLTESLEVINWQVTGLQPVLDGPDLNLIAPLKTAYEFLALHLRTAIYKASPSVDAAREALLGDVLDSKFLFVERLHAPEPKPFHGIVFEGNTPYAKVVIRLFGKLAFRVHFLHLAVSGPRCIYMHKLDTGEESLSKLPD
jgi:HNH endonuclease